MEVLYPDRYASLRAHKSLPRRRVVSSERQKQNGPDGSHRRTTDPTVQKSDIPSWLQNSSELISNPNHALPLTPPPLPQDAEEQDSVKDHASVVEDSSAVQSTVVLARTSTPVIPRSPLTPELTPPRNPQGLPLQVPSPLPPDRSSRTNSFTTAQERPSFDADWRPTEQPPERKRSDSIGLGLGLEQSSAEQTPNANARIIKDANPFEQSPAEPQNTVQEDELLVAEPAAVQQIKVGKRPKKHFTDHPSGFWDGSPSPNAYGTSSGPSPLLQEELRATREASRIAAEYLRSRERNSPPDLRNGNDSGLLPVDPKRLSQMSATSTIVEAMVVDTTPQKRHKLRHTSKVSSLRAASSPQSGSNRSSAASGELKHKLHHKNGRITSWGNRVSINSDSGISMGVDGSKKADEAIPASEVPQRRSSLKSRKRLTRPAERVSRRIEQQRPSTAPDQSDAKEIQKPKKRVVSEPVELLEPIESRGRPAPKQGPVIPVRSSSLSAPTSRNNSCSASLTSASLKRHSSQQAAQAQRQSWDSDHRNRSSVVRHLPETPKDDGHGLRPPSLIRTPFSAASLLSSTPGPIELNEATAVSIFPHTNRSVLVVQQRARPDSHAPETTTSITQQVTIALPGGLTSHPPAPAAPEPALASPPLENPRAAPAAPTVLLIPPTPATQLSATPQPSAPSTRRAAPPSTGPFSSLRRALSSRRYSESQAAPVRRSFRRSTSLGASANRRPATADGAPAARLGPFWKPRGFWDDIDDSDGDDDETDRGRLPPTSDRTRPSTSDAPVRNTLGLPQLASIAGPAALARRLGSLRRRQREGAAPMDEGLKPRHHRRRASEGLPRRGAWGSAARAEHQAPPAMRGDGQSGGGFFDPRGAHPWAHLQGAVERVRAKRTEERLEKQRERLKRNIGPAVLQTDSQGF